MIEIRAQLGPTPVCDRMVQFLLDAPAQNSQ
jgi:hypothetical protein